MADKVLTSDFITELRLNKTMAVSKNSETAIVSDAPKGIYKPPTYDQSNCDNQWIVRYCFDAIMVICIIITSKVFISLTI